MNLDIASVLDSVPEPWKARLMVAGAIAICASAIVTNVNHIIELIGKRAPWLTKALGWLNYAIAWVSTKQPGVTDSTAK